MSTGIGIRQWNRIWGSYSISAAGTAIAAGIFPIIAIVELNASPAAVTTMAAVSAVAGGVIATWGSRVFEHFPVVKVLRLVETVQFLMLASLLAAAALDGLTFVHLVVAATSQTVGYIIYAAGFSLHMKLVLRDEELINANSRVEATNWSTQTIGPVIGGALVSALGAFVSVAVDAVSFLAAALGLTRVSEPAPTEAPDPSGSPSSPRGGGLRHIWQNPTLRALYLNAMTLGGGLLMTSPLLALLMLRELHLPPWQYGLVLGLPAAAGLAGALSAQGINRRLGGDRTLLIFGALRGPCLLPLVFVPTAPSPALAVVLVSQCVLLFAAGVFNPSFATTRLRLCPAGLLTRVTAAWSASAKVVQPACIAAGGLLAAQWSVRSALMAAAALGVLSAVMLPWNLLRTANTEQRQEQAIRSVL
ncbi:MFS transporter [Streptosporangium sp. NPDC000396]|uniref:MFS transporter n=1 Tax=Streptosporangium sp. NPDC000396 TaxID=3366185 RepID=UPI00367706BC